jgi:ribosomal protein S19
MIWRGKDLRYAVGLDETVDALKRAWQKEARAEALEDAMSDNVFVRSVTVRKRFIEHGIAVWKTADVHLRIAIDFEQIGTELGERAATNKSRRSVLGSGMIIVEAPRTIEWTEA